MTEQLVVSTENGRIRGRKQKDYLGGKVYSFTGIPYAKAPVGELRFKAPEPAENWEGVRNATKDGAEAPAIYPIPKVIRGREDNCLNLNVYARELPRGNSGEQKIPVMVFIHGGGFIIGSNRKNLYGPDFLLTENVVLVVINYRLGIFGFLNLDDQSLNVPGNAGLKDQVMALKWIQRNIQNFGGDPNNVTIFGQSAGSASVHYLTLSPLTKGLFHKAIMQSGTAINCWAKGCKNGKIVAKLMGYQEDIDDKTLLQKLCRASKKSVLQAQARFNDRLFSGDVRPFGPVVEYPHEGAFITEDPDEIIESGKHQSIPMIIGYNSQEGLFYESVRKVVPQSRHRHHLEDDIPYELKIPEKSDKARKLADELKRFYYKDAEITLDNIKNRYILYSDTHFVYGIQKTISLLQRHSSAPVYVYRMNVDSSLNFLTACCQTNYLRTVAVLSFFIGASGKTHFKNLFTNLRKKLLVKNKDNGICHGDENFYILSSFLCPSINIGSKEDTYVQRFVKLWANFAKYGDPTPEVLEIFNDTKWVPNSAEDINNILEIGENLEMTENRELERKKFWDRIFQEYSN